MGTQARSDRWSGVLCHITALPSKYCVGSCGHEARKFVDLLSKCGQSVWQMLPLGPPDVAGLDVNCPYMSSSAFALHPLLICPDLLLEESYITTNELKEFKKLCDAIPPRQGSEGNHINFLPVWETHCGLHAKAFTRFKAKAQSDNQLQANYKQFCADNKCWLDDYCAFVVLANEHPNETSWLKRPNKRSILNKAKRKNLDLHRFVQFEAERQYLELRKYANTKGVHILGDVPIYVGGNSADCWANENIFMMNKETGNPLYVSGVPPDLFSETGQLWCHPVFDWSVLKSRKFDWWVQRMQRMNKLYDMVRIDHFRGFESFWGVPYKHSITVKTAAVGQWFKAPGMELMNTLSDKLGWEKQSEEESVCLSPPIVAEDLGIITKEVREMSNRHNLASMRVLQFAFGDDDHNEHLPHNVGERVAIFTGTHDNNTAVGWWEKDASAEEKERFLEYTGVEKFTSFAMIRAAMNSPARLCITPVQDICEYGADARFNNPGDGLNPLNWSWHMKTFDDLSAKRLNYFGNMTARSGRHSRERADRQEVVLDDPTTHACFKKQRLQEQERAKAV
eukprot:Selendium_serpulae@DN6213_c1_g1_i1.p1